jgi:FkbM family methyltransferase
MLKQTIKKILIALRIDLTKNIHYDRLTLKVLDEVLKRDSNCVDIGCHKGEILDEMLKRSPNGSHYAFEPIPGFYGELKKKYNSPNIHLYDIALSNETGETTFNYVVDAPAYSGLRKRDYAIAEPTIEVIPVKLDLLDNVLPADYPVNLIKLDVEGAEYNVLLGAGKTLKNKKPVIIFEFGLGASDHYDVTPESFFDYLSHTCGYGIYLLKDFIKKRDPLNREDFVDIYHRNAEYYFVAAPV